MKLPQPAYTEKMLHRYHLHEVRKCLVKILMIDGVLVLNEN